MQNPFQYGKVVSDPYFIDRESELQSLIQDVLGRHNVVLHSPRRYGKTSLLFRLAKCVQDRGYNILYLDFYRITSRASFIELYSREIFSQSGKSWKFTLKKMGQLLKGIRPVVSIDALGNPSLSVNFETANLQPETMESVLNLTEVLDSTKQWLVIFDEFQEITKLHGDSFESTLRSMIQNHTRSTYLFSGSRHHLLLDIFNNPGGAFYHFGKVMRLEKIDPELMSAFIVDRFKQTGIEMAIELSREIVTRAGNIPNYVQYLASEVWHQAIQSLRTPDPAMLETALSNMLDNLNDFFFQTWEGVSLQQKKVLIALSKENTLVFSQEYHNRNHLGAISTSQRAVQKLLADQIIDQTVNGYEFCDPFFLLFLRLRMIT